MAAVVVALTHAHLPLSMRWLFQRSKTKTSKTSRNPPENSDGARGVQGDATQKTRILPGRHSVKTGASGATSTLPNNDAPRHMFGDNIAITGGQFTQTESVTIHNVNTKAFELLQKRVATSAFHNSAKRFDPPRCHPDTRVAILQRIYNWIIQSDDRDTWLLWLNGAAGAGKSAIIQSIAERCTEAAIAIASFFFFRADPSRNAIKSLVATLAYQLMQVIPETSEDILRTVERNPLIFEQTFDSQLQQLLVQPLLRLRRDLQRPFVVFIDGLDECNNRAHQSNLIEVLGNVSRSRNCPIVFLIASRREPQIEASFVHKPVSRLVLTLPLDNSDVEQTSDDIRHFLIDKFNDIKETHLCKQLLPIDWPPALAITEITSKSSGQFIYASVVVKYVSSPRANPSRQLDIVRDICLRDASSQNPFVHLDALYQHIFSQVEALDKVFDILAFVLITGYRHIIGLEHMFLLDAGELGVSLVDLTAVIECLANEFKFLHASLPDFLRDKSRSQRYHINVDEYITKLLCMLLDRVPRVLSSSDISGSVAMTEYYRTFAIVCLLKQVKVLDRLQRSFMNFHFTYFEINHPISAVKWAIEILTALGQLDLGDQHRAYHHVLETLAVEFSKNWEVLDGDNKDLVKKHPDLHTRISQILQEQA